MSGAPGSGKGARQLPAGLRGDGAIVRKHTATKGFRADSSVRSLPPPETDSQ